jgi:hypothetical protein
MMAKLSWATQNNLPGAPPERYCQESKPGKLRAADALPSYI